MSSEKGLFFGKFCKSVRSMDYLFEIECTGKSLIFVMGQYLRISFITLIHKTSPVMYKFLNLFYY